MKEAKEGKVAFQASFEELDSAITREHHSAWTAEVERWEDNPNDPNIINPFEPKCVGMLHVHEILFRANFFR